MTPRHKTGTNGAPWVEYDSPKPPSVADRYAFWLDPPPLMSPRCEWWLRQITSGWRPNRRVGGAGYDEAAQWYGVWIWEYLHMLRPAMRAPRPWEPQLGHPESAIEAMIRVAVRRRGASNDHVGASWIA